MSSSVTSASSAQTQINQMQATFEQAIASSMQITQIETTENTKLDASKQRPQNG